MGETASKARGLLKQITCGEFVLGIMMSLPAINLLESLNKAVQSRSVAISSAVAVEVTCEGLEGLRMEEAFHENLPLVSSAVKSWVLRLLNYFAFVTGQRDMKLDRVQITCHSSVQRMYLNSHQTCQRDKSHAQVLTVKLRYFTELLSRSFSCLNQNVCRLSCTVFRLFQLELLMLNL